jgi:hypothetical protein
MGTMFLLAALLRPIRRWHPWQRLALLAWVLLLVVVGARVLLRPGMQSVGGIFAQAGRDWLAGADVYGLDRPASGVTAPTTWADLFRPIPRLPPGWGTVSYRYSPLMAGLFVPLGLLPEGLGELLLRLANAVALIAAACWWLRRAAPYPLSRAEQGFFLFALALFSVSSINNGQTNPLLLALLLAAVTACTERRFTLASVFVGLAFWLKLYPLAFGLLLAGIYPRRLGWRLPLVVLLLGGAVFLLQRPTYVVKEYLAFFRVLRLEDRSDWPARLAYRDLRLLCRVWGLPPSPAAYSAVRLASAVLVAALVLAGRHWPVRRRLMSALNLGLCWILLCGPATEGATYQLLGPALAWTLIDVWRRGGSLARAVAMASAAAFGLGLISNLFPNAADLHGLGPHPLSALLLFGLLVGLDLRDLHRPVPTPIVSAVVVQRL